MVRVRVRGSGSPQPNAPWQVGVSSRPHVLAPHPLFWGKQFVLIAEARQVPEPMAMINSGGMVWVSRGPGCQVLHV